MKFFFPDSQDQINPFFDFRSEQLPVHRVRQRDDLYAHEVLRSKPFDGLLVSKPIVDGMARAAGRYSMAQRHRLYRIGVRAFFRLDEGTTTMGDCGAFTYVNEVEPPYTPDEVIDFYEGCGFDRGVAPDHVVFAFVRSDGTAPNPEDVAEWDRRIQLSIDNAARFHERHSARKCTFEPVATAHGWNAETYAASVASLQEAGYGRVALGGMVPLKTTDILETLKAVAEVRKGATELHLFGVTRCDEIPVFASYGVTSFDSTSPFRQAFKDDKHNYYAPDGAHYVALRVPQTDANAALKRRIAAGQIDQREAIDAERRCLRVLDAFESETESVDNVVDALVGYERLLGSNYDHETAYRTTLEAAPWRSCRCGICEHVGIDVVIFRGSERNKRRGFHNLAIFRERLEGRVAHSNEELVPT